MILATKGVIKMCYARSIPIKTDHDENGSWVLDGSKPAKHVHLSQLLVDHLD